MTDGEQENKVSRVLMAKPPPQRGSRVLCLTSCGMTAILDYGRGVGRFKDWQSNDCCLDIGNAAEPKLFL